MRRRSLILAGVVALTFMASTQVVQAQQPLVVNIPFDFVAGGTNLPAGEYSIKTWGPMDTLLVMSRTDPAESAVVPSNSAAAVGVPQESKLVFNRYGDRYFLAAVWTAGSSIGRQLPKSEREKEMAQSAKIEARSQVMLTASLTK